MIVYGQNELIARWVAEHIEGCDGFPPDSQAVGVMHEGQCLAGVVWSEYRGHQIMASIYASSPRWLARPRETLRELFNYPFKQLGCERVAVVAARSNERALKMNRRLGFKAEGLMRRGWDGVEDAVLMGMLRGECRWIEEAVRNGQS